MPRKINVRLINASNATSNSILSVSNGNVAYSNISSFLVGYATNAQLASYATNSQLVGYATNAQLASYATNAQLASYATNAQLASYATNAQLSSYVSTSSQLVTLANLTVTGNLTVLGNTVQFNANTLTVTDPLIQVGVDNNSSDVIDLGFFGHYYGGSPATERHAGLFRDATDGQFKLFTNLDPTPDSIVDTANASYTSANLVLNYAVGKVSDISNHTTSSLTEGTNLYFTNARSYSNVTQLGYITASSLSGYATNAQLSSYALSANLTTANVTEVTNLYFTNARSYSNVTSIQFTSSNFAPNLTLGGAVTFLGSGIEKSNVIISNAPTTIVFNPFDQAVTYFAVNATSTTTVTVNFIGIHGMATGNVMSATVMLTNNPTFNVYVNTVQIEGSAASTAGSGGTVNSGGTPTGNTLRWQTSAPVVGLSNVEVYSFSIIKQAASSYLVLASKSNFS